MDESEQDPIVPEYNIEWTDLRVQQNDMVEDSWFLSSRVTAVGTEPIQWSDLEFRVQDLDEHWVLNFNETIPLIGTYPEEPTCLYKMGPRMNPDFVEVGDLVIIAGLKRNITDSYFSVLWPGHQGFFLIGRVGPVLLDLRRESADDLPPGPDHTIDIYFNVTDIEPERTIVLLSEISIRLEYDNGTRVTPDPTIKWSMSREPNGYSIVYLGRGSSGDRMELYDSIVVANAPPELIFVWLHIIWDKSTLGSVQIEP